MTRQIVRLACSLMMVVAIAACGNDGGNDGGGSSVLPSIKARGGKGLSGAGGLAKTVQIVSSQGGDVALLRSGGVPALPVVPQPTAPDLGANPRTISGEVTLESSSFPFHGDDDLTDATGLWVKSGATLTLSSGGDSGMSLTLAAGIQVDGTLRTSTLTAGAPADLTLHARTMAIGSDGRVDLSGADATDTGPGFPGADCVLIIQEGFVNQGQILARGGGGGSAGAGGKGGLIQLNMTSGSFLNTGLIDSSGGEGPGGAGGDAGPTPLRCGTTPTSSGDFLSAGRLIARGGNGKSAGGDGAQVMLHGCQTGRTMSSGLLDASGGDATEDGPGGNAGQSIILAFSNQVFLAGQIFILGGKGVSSGDGGYGGMALFTVEKTAAAAQSSQGLFVTAEIDVSGGEGAAGGDSGIVSLSEEASDLSDPPGTTLVISGLQSIDVSGGEGATIGGDGGHLTVNSNRNSGTTVRIGSVTSELSLYANGGQGLAGNGGAAGTIGLKTDDSDPKDIAALDRALTVTGSLYAVGGQGTAAGGRGGSVGLYDHFKVDARGAIDASGGRGGSAEGGEGGHVICGGQGAVFAPVIIASGGASQANQGGVGGAAYVSGAQVTVANAVTLDGGAGGGSLGGGDGGQVQVTGTTETHVTAVCSVRPGAGTPAGTDGQVVINGATEPLTDGQYRP